MRQWAVMPLLIEDGLNAAMKALHTKPPSEEK